MKKVFETIYKLSSSGKIQVWSMEQNDEQYRTISGQQNGKLITTDWTTAKSKNEGKKNETSGIQQATLEIESQYKKKLSQGNYKSSIDDINEDNYFEPMLAKDYNDHKPTKYGLEKGSVYSNPKLDGMRCIANKDGLWSRQGKQIVSCPHISEILKPLFDKSPDLVLDGELYNHSLKDNFNEIMSLAKQSKPTKSDLEASAKSIQYHIYDCYDGSAKVFSKRYEQYGQLLASLPNNKIISFVGATQVKDQHHLDELYGQYIEDGYEGQIVRIDGFPYENKRTKNLLKRKEFQDAEFEIKEILEGEGNRSGMAGAIMYKLPDGREFRSGIKGGVDFYKQLLVDKESYIGGQGTVKFFQLTPEQINHDPETGEKFTDLNAKGGIPRFPVTIAVYKTKRDT